MKKLFAFLVFIGLHCSTFAVTNPPGWDTSYRVVNGQQVWLKGGGEWLQPGEATFTGASTGNLKGVTDVVPKMKDGRGVALKVTRIVSGAALFSVAKQIALGSGVGALLVAVPAFVEWVAGDNAQNIKIENGALNKKNPEICTVAPCYEYGYSNINKHLSFSGACQAYATDTTQYNAAAVNRVYVSSTPTTACMIQLYNLDGTKYDPSPSNYAVYIQAFSKAAQAPEWMAASMDDIGPYMTPRTPPTTLPEQLMTQTKQPLPATPLSFEGPPTPPTPPAPYVVTTKYPKPADKTSTETVKGNPHGLPSNTPTITKRTTGTASVNPGNTTTSGPKPDSVGAPNRDPVQVPTTTETTSTYNPTTDETVSNTVTKQNEATKTSTSTTTTTISNTTTNNTYNSTVINNVVTNTTYIDNTTGQELQPPETETGPETPPEEELSECEKSPDVIGCSKYGEAPTPDELVKTDHAVSITAVPFASSSACPGALTFGVRGFSYSVAYNPLCDKLAQLKTLFLALAAMVAAYVVVQALKV